MTIYEKMQQSKEFCASMLSRAFHGTEFEDFDYDPIIMDALDKEFQEDTDEG